MVFFVCEACNESLKKNKVETHSYTCRNCWVLTCVDCNQQFSGDTYAAHNSCVSEAERYEGKLFDGRANKGDVKQALWLGRVQACAAEPSVLAHLRPHVERLLQHDNIPRKRAKFENFAKNSLRLHDPKTLGALWSIFEKAAAPPPAAPAAEQPALGSVSGQAAAAADQPGGEQGSAGRDAAPEPAREPRDAEPKRRAEEDAAAPRKRAKGGSGEVGAGEQKKKRDKAEKKEKREKRALKKDKKRERKAQREVESE